MNNPTLLKNLRNIPDFPIPGVQFKDVTTLFKNAKCMKIMLNELYEIYKDKGITKVVGIESRLRPRCRPCGETGCWFRHVPETRKASGRNLTGKLYERIRQGYDRNT